MSPEALPDVFGIPVFVSEACPPDKVLLSGGAMWVHSRERLDHLLFLEEIKAIVRLGIKKAHPWVMIPRASHRDPGGYKQA